MSNEAFTKFTAHLAEVVNSTLTESNPARERREVQLEPGVKYTRVVVANFYGDNKAPTSRYAYAFIENATGNLYKPDGWKRPTKNVVRGNVNDDSWRAWCGPYGIASAK